MVATMLPLTGCVVIPYTPSSETKHDRSDVANPEYARLTVGPREFLEKMAKETLQEDDRLEQVDGQTFIDTASPDQELTLARLLEPGTQALIEPLDVDYLVLFGIPKDETLEKVGGGVAYLGFYGLEKDKTSTTYWAAVIDLHELLLVEQLTTQSIGTDVGIGLFYGLFVASDTAGGARKGVIHHVVETIANAKPTGSVRVVFLADEPIQTPEEVVAQARILKELPPRWSVSAYPEFAAAAPPVQGQGLVYIFRPDKLSGSLMPIDVHTESGTTSTGITYLWSGGYFPFYVAAGPVSLWAESEPSQTVTLDVKPGETYYVKGSTAIGWSTPHPRLEIVATTSAMKDIRKCRLVPTTQVANLETQRFAEQGYADRQVELGTLYTTGVNYPNGESMPRDVVEAYKWYSIAATTSSKAWRSLATTSLDALAATMDATQIAEAQQRARDWTEAHEKRL
jgi:hypothetical protein